ncbi:MAG: hypothetical protein IPP90_15860 [Gemmatimonadaceae bacterium]|nr:hypothetical protein [Gemmatimonadaceae bacterium]
MKWDFNAQGQPKIVWPPSFSLAKAYTDQLERKQKVSASKISDIRAQIAGAEKGQQRRAQCRVGQTGDRSPERQP